MELKNNSVLIVGLGLLVFILLIWFFVLPLFQLPSADTLKNQTNGSGNGSINDVDLDGVINNEDNCPTVFNSEQGDQDEDKKGDACDINLFIRNFTFDPLSENITIHPALTTTEESGYYIIQFVDGKEQDVVASLTAQNGETLGLLAQNGLLVFAPSLSKKTIQGIENVRFVDIYQPAYKLDSDLYNMLVKGELENNNESLSLEVNVFKNIKDIENEITAIGGNVSRLYQPGDEYYNKELLVTIPETQLINLSSLADVRSIRMHSEITLRLNRATVITNIRAAPNAPTIFGLTGDGQTIGISDSGIDTGDLNTLLPDIKGRITSISKEWKDEDGHGTHVVGIAIGDGSISAAAGPIQIKGAAPKAKVVFLARRDKDSVPNTLTKKYNAGAKILSNSWGSDDGPAYDDREFGLDKFLREHPDAIVLFAATNDFPTITLGTPDVSKNALIVGASENDIGLPAPVGGVPLGNNFFAASSERVPLGGIPDVFQSGGLIGTIAGQANNENDWSGFTGNGPTTDGRIKPDVVAPGTWILSLRSLVCEPEDKSWPPDGVIEDNNGDGVIDHKDCIGLGLAGSPAQGYGPAQTYELVDVERISTGTVLLQNFVIRTIDENALISIIETTRGSPGDFRISSRTAIPANSILPPAGGAAMANSYMYLSGASMSTPLVAGMAALVREYLQTIKEVKSPSGMLLKAFIINGAVDMTNAGGNTGPIPDNREGWGRVDLIKSIAPDQLASRVKFVDKEKFTTAGQVYKIKNVRFSAGKPISITLTWYDVADAGGAGALINDLDMKLFTPSDRIYRGGAPSFIAGVSQPNRPKDSRNNVEKIYIPSAPEDGLYEIKIVSDKIRANNPQEFAIVYSTVVGVDSAGKQEQGFEINYSHNFTNVGPGVFAIVQGLDKEEAVDIYVMNTRPNWPDNLALKDIRNSPADAKTDKYGEINSSQLLLVWPTPTNWIYYKNDDGKYNLIVDRNKNSIYEKAADLLDYSAKAGFRVQAIASADSSNAVKKVFTTSDNAVYVHGRGFVNAVPVTIYALKDITEPLANSISKKTSATDLNGAFSDIVISSPSNYIYSEERGDGRYLIKVDANGDDVFNAYHDSSDNVMIPDLVSAASGNGTVKKGNKGAAIEQLQALLNAYGFKTEVTGVFDDKTASALNEYFKSRKLKPDGEVGAGDIANLVADADISFRVQAVTSAAADGKIAKVFNKGEGIYAKGAGFIPKTEVNIYLTAHSPNRGNGSQLSDVTDSDYEEAVVNASGGTGNLQMQIEEESVLEPGKYDVVVDTDRDGKFNKNNDTVDRVRLYQAEEIDKGNNFEQVLANPSALAEIQTFLKIFVDPTLKVTGQLDAQAQNALKKYEEINEINDREKIIEKMKKETDVSIRIQEVKSIDKDGVDKNEFSPSEGGDPSEQSVYAYGLGFPSERKVRIYVVKHKNSWKHGDMLTDGSGGYEETKTDADGNLLSTLIWNNIKESDVGEYDIIVDVDRDGNFTNIAGSKDGIDKVGAFGFKINPPGGCDDFKKLINISKNWTDDEKWANNEKWNLAVYRLISLNISLSCQVNKLSEFETQTMILHAKGPYSRSKVIINGKLETEIIYRNGVNYAMYAPLLEPDERDPDFADCIWIIPGKDDPTIAIDTTSHLIISAYPFSDYEQSNASCSCADFDMKMFEPEGKVCDISGTPSDE